MLLLGLGIAMQESMACKWGYEREHVNSEEAFYMCTD